MVEETGEKTKLTLRTLHGSAEQKDMYEKMGAVGGWQSSFDRLAEHLASLSS